MRIVTLPNCYQSIFISTDDWHEEVLWTLLLTTGNSFSLFIKAIIFFNLTIFTKPSSLKYISINYKYKTSTRDQVEVHFFLNSCTTRIIYCNFPWGPSFHHLFYAKNLSKFNKISNKSIIGWIFWRLQWETSFEGCWNGREGNCRPEKQARFLAYLSGQGYFS